MPAPYAADPLRITDHAPDPDDIPLTKAAQDFELGDATPFLADPSATLDVKEACEKFWADVAALLQKAEDKP